MASQSGEALAHGLPDTVVADGAADAAPGPAARPASPPPKKAPDELLCTICGLTACWTAPGKPPRPATPPASSETGTSA